MIPMSETARRRGSGLIPASHADRMVRNFEKHKEHDFVARYSLTAPNKAIVLARTDPIRAKRR